MNATDIHESPSRPSDVALVERWRQGDRRAGDVLVARHVAEVRAYFGRRIQGPDSEDLVQDTLSRLTRAIHHYEQRSSFKTYLFTIASNTLKDYLRRSYRRVRCDPLQGTEVSDQCALEEELLGQERRMYVRASVWSLPPAQRDLAVLFYLDELKARHIAKEKGLKEGTVRRRLHTARKHMLVYLQTHHTVLFDHEQRRLEQRRDAPTATL